MVRTIVAVLAVTALGIATALAQTAPAPTHVTWAEIIMPWAQTIAAAVVAVVVALLGWIAALIKTKTGIQIDNGHMLTLQSAIENAAGRVIIMLGDQLKDKRIELHSPVIRDAVLYVNGAAPDALRHFGLDAQSIAERILAKIGTQTAQNPEMSPQADLPTPSVPPATSVST